MSRFSVVGMGPGDGRYMLPDAWEAIGAADLIVGARRHLDLCRGRYPNTRAAELCGAMKDTLEMVDRERRCCRVALLVSGDPCLYSLHRAVSERFAAEEYDLIPGLSSFQLVCAKARVAYDDAQLVSVHGKDLKVLDTVSTSRRLVVFTDARNNAARVATVLASRLGENRRAVAGERIGYHDERLVTGTLGKIAQNEFGGLCVLIIL